MKKYITDFRVVSNTGVKARMFRLILTPADGSPMGECRPGQFVEVRVDKDPRVFLRRPISIHAVDPERNELHLLIQVAGRGTETLATLVEGDLVNLVYPLGNGYSCVKEAGVEENIPTANEHYLLIGGGVGIAPLLELGKDLKKQGKCVTYLLGLRSLDADMEYWLKPYRDVAPVYLTTEDGSAGEKGFVTNSRLLSKDAIGEYSGVRMCGPMPMMKAAVAKLREIGFFEQEKNLENRCQVSLENKMACGLGVCLCCVEDTQEGHKCVCSEGPVFNVEDLKW